MYHCQGRLNNAIKIGGRFINPILLESELKCSFDFLNVLVISDQTNLILKVFLFTLEIQKDVLSKEKIKGKIYENISNKINVKINIYLMKSLNLLGVARLIENIIPILIFKSF